MSSNIFRTIIILAPILLEACSSPWSVAAHTDDFKEIFFATGAGDSNSASYKGTWEPSKIKCTGHTEAINLTSRWSSTLSCEDGRTLEHDVYATGIYNARGTGTFSDGTVITLLGGHPGYAEREYKKFKKEQARRLAAAPPPPAPQTTAKSAPGGGTNQVSANTAKPNVFIAYPKGGEELAEDNINVVGYVTSENQTKKFRVFLNHLPLGLKDLWTNAPLETSGLRGFPIELTLPLQPGENRFQFQIQDERGFVDIRNITVKRIELNEGADSTTATILGLPERLGNIAVAKHDMDVTGDNFMTVLGDWVRDTAKTDYNKGNVMFDQGRYARAAYYYRKAVKTDPFGQAWFNLGISEKVLGNENRAEESFSNACRLQISQACDGAS